MEQSTISLCRTVPATDKYDVVVCGGGSAGWVAAVSAARAGCRTALIERYGFLGGTATAGLVVPLSGCFFQGRRVVGGITWEFVQRLEQLGAAHVELPKGHVSFHPEYYKLTAQAMAEESGVTLYTNTSLLDCVKENGSIRYVVIHNKGGIQAIGGSCFIDATGDGDLCHLSGVPMLEQAPDGLQPLSLCFLLEGVDTETELLRHSIRHNGFDGRPSCNQTIRRCLERRCGELGDLQFGGPWFNTLYRGNCLVVNMTRAGVDATDPRAYTQAESQLRRDMVTLVEILREEFPEFAHCEIVASAVNAGIRETRRIRGVYTMTAEDVTHPTAPACPVAHSAHPMDIHAAKGSAQSLVQLEHDLYVPYETMVCREVDNLIAAGRCISVTREPYASIRVMGTLMSLGESAGIAAALQAKLGCPAAALPRQLLREQIRQRAPFF